ncbi:MAG: hypothetical protein A2268_07260 [Candidatus Raymondbacteria bacterium RifOxyA12_full_50_37]|uniref:HTH arsR-type domain-containing protein n=1 Tax=Candidatus Raymondbacteria bacterium RIFOXYD12_FULL_49_13 TaxID=1817890 RepID=A0A1F7FEN3_UNCRA|nr:MAG: hypothetical protein A2350_11200 [Candidatus Raymondbacteria bacterium RifOxyB12_full_50_8]OGJ89772.1 MAG: hypothetical protein A2268_07260 [Candidatus Raymondbacteria bacterium RifOxyA12_full_50_37]OGJ91180.1 MAG: hypothetical protein A2248_01405 [Candidatus Raymondbacteria bacterium RIFOXYA2_FULL_49_16]OGJ96313.1 MAG: hypothetical protein A2487_00615 [Candidatus Raymondbacteria bacterium RifOxyC12_full_50_8]OGJ97578.1 MAG: hypothetical protein A2453_02170 [Candidatus Raymondbacteria b
MKEIVSIAKALSDENRIKALMVLCGREVCVCQIVEFLKLAPSTVSKHMSILKAAGLVESRRDEKWIYYKLAKKGTTPAVKSILEWLSNHLGRCVDKDSCCGVRIPKSIKDNICPKPKR